MVQNPAYSLPFFSLYYKPVSNTRARARARVRARARFPSNFGSTAKNRKKG